MSPDKPTPDKPAANPAVPSSVPPASTGEPLPIKGVLTAEDIREIADGGLTLGDAIRRIESAAE